MLKKQKKLVIFMATALVATVYGLVANQPTTAQQSRTPIQNVEVTEILNAGEQVIFYSENVTIPTSVSAEFIDRHLAGTPMAGLGAAFKKAEADYGVNALFLAGLAVHESNFGRSAIAQAKNNLFGFMAYDSSPFESAGYFPSMAAGIDHVARYLRNHYLTPGAAYYNGTSVTAINVKYASDKLWASKIVQHVRRFLAH